MGNTEFKERIREIGRAYEGVPKNDYDRGFRDALALFVATYCAYHPENMPKMEAMESSPTSSRLREIVR